MPRFVHHLINVLQIALAHAYIADFAGAGDCTQDEAWSYLKETLAFAEQTSWIAMYSAYGTSLNSVFARSFVKPIPHTIGFQTDLGNVNSVNALMDSNGQVTALGRYYLDTVF